MKKWFKFARGRYKLRLTLALFALILCFVATFIFFNRHNVSADINPKEEKYLPNIEFSETDFLLKIDRLGVLVPVVPDIDGSDKEIYFASLQRGVAHMAGTAKPGEKGNVVIFGHSNFYENDPGAFKQIFKHLDELEPQDEIIIHYKDNDYRYKVQKQQLVKPTDTWVIDAPYDLTLITCWPPGTIEKRLIIFANLES
ncbi:MAG: class D sortase [Candidatus Berkelbacteria bacterium]|nr:class D sortase [Candidatus Berkelbacteria bacterium]